MMETPLAMLNVGEIAHAALDSETRLAGFVMGTNDLAKDTRARLVPGRAPMLPWLMNCVAAARAYGLDILDGVYNDLGNAEGFVEECKQARDLGFDGKTLIHPRQIEPCNEAFSPSPEEVEVARKMIAAFDLPENENKGVIQIDGRMVERLHAEMARPHGGDRGRDREAEVGSAGQREAAIVLSSGLSVRPALERRPEFAAGGMYCVFWLQKPPMPRKVSTHCSKLANPQFVAPPPAPPYCPHQG